ncbi:unnamed protein product [Cercospora beticola]|nr:unnamed protein product [Cercospora beticola]
MFIQLSPSSLPPQTRRPSAVHQLNHYPTHYTTFVALSKRDTQDPIIEPLQRFKSEGDTEEEQNSLGGQMAFGDDNDVLRRIEEEQRAQEALKVFHQKTLRSIVGADLLQKDRFSHWSIRGYAYARKNHIEVSELNWHDINDNPHRRRAWSGPGVVWVGLDSNGNVLFQDWPEHYKEPIRTSSTKLIELDLSERLDIFEKCHRLHETARCFQLAEEAGHITRHEAQLIIDLEVCYKAGVKLLRHKKILPGVDEWPELAQQQQQGKEIFAEMQQCYGTTLFPCIETVVIAARYLDNMWDHADRGGYQWLLSDSKFLDIFLLRMHNFMWRTHGPAKYRQTIHNLPLGNVCSEHSQKQVQLPQQPVEPKFGAQKASIEMDGTNTSLQFSNQLKSLPLVFSNSDTGLKFLPTFRQA